MPQSRAVRRLVKQLELIRWDFTEDARSEKIDLLREVLTLRTLNADLLERLHSVASFVRAFPDDAVVHSRAQLVLQSFAERVAKLGVRRSRELDDSGLVGSTLWHEFGFDMARWLDRRFDGQVELAWDRFDSPERLDDLLAQFLTCAEEPSWEESALSTREWITLAKGDMSTTDLSWLLHQIRGGRSRRAMLAELYDDAEVPLRWRLDGHRASKTLNEVYWLARAGRRDAWRKPPANIRREITRPVRGIKRLSVPKAQDVIDVARTALATRHREVHAMTYANPQEVYLAPVGMGVHIAVMGVLPEHRLPIEGNFGYVILAHGVPIGYGGASPLFSQANTGVSLFDEYRRGESPFLFLQVLRVMRALFNTDRFIANPYQFGLDNDDAMASGAFWFYYKLGFRPADAKIRRLALRVAGTMRGRTRSRPNRTTMKALCSTDLHLTVGDGRAERLFQERWLAVLGRSATGEIAKQGIVDRDRAVRALMSGVAAKLGATRWRQWPPAQRSALKRLAPVLSAVPSLSRWGPATKRACIALIRAKGGRCERDYARLLARHRTLCRALSAIAQRDEAS